MISGSLRLSGVTIRFPSGGVPKTASEPRQERSEPVRDDHPTQEPEQASTGSLFAWAIPDGDLGTHRVGDQLATMLTATYQGQKVADYTISAGALPPRIEVGRISGVLRGTLTETGRFGFTVRARYGNDVSDASYALTVS